MCSRHLGLFPAASVTLETIDRVIGLDGDLAATQRNYHTNR